jgi:hypothetical protein
LAVANYESAESRFPPPFVAGEDGRSMHSWRILLLPYIEQHDVYKAYDQSQPWDGSINAPLAGRMPRMYAHHGDYKPGSTITNYLVVVGSNTVWNPDKRVSAKDIKDGSATTLLIPENRGLNVHWMEPRDFDFARMDWTINSPKGISSKYDAPAAVMLDGSVRRLSPAISAEALRALITIDGGEEVVEQDGTWQLLPDGRKRPVTKP